MQQKSNHSSEENFSPIIHWISRIVFGFYKVPFIWMIRLKFSEYLEWIFFRIWLLLSLIKRFCFYSEVQNLKLQGMMYVKKDTASTWQAMFWVESVGGEWMPFRASGPKNRTKRKGSVSKTKRNRNGKRSRASWRDLSQLGHPSSQYKRCTTINQRFRYVTFIREEQ